MPAELSAPITSRESTQNGGKEGGLTIQSELGLDPKALKLPETAFNEFSSESQKTEAYGEPVSSQETTSRTRRYDRAWQTASIRFWSSIYPAATLHWASSLTTKDESAGKAKP
jgi:hypothetical protein